VATSFPVPGGGMEVGRGKGYKYCSGEIFHLWEEFSSHLLGNLGTTIE